MPTNLVAIGGLESIDDVVEEVKDFDGRFVGESWQRPRRQRVLVAHGDQR